MKPSKLVITRGVARWDEHLNRYVTESVEGFDYDGPWALALNRTPIYAAGEWQFFADTGNPGSTSLASVNTNASVGSQTKFRFRAVVGETNNANTSNTGAWRLQFRVNGTGGYATVATASGACRATTSSDAGFTDGNMAQLLTTLSGSTYNTAYDEAETANATASQTWADDSTEYEWCLIASGLNPNDYIEFQVLDPAGAVKTFASVPQITLLDESMTGAPGQGSAVVEGLAPSIVSTVAVGLAALAMAGEAPALATAPYGGGGYGGLLAPLALNFSATQNVSRSPDQAALTTAGAEPSLVVDSGPLSVSPSFAAVAANGLQPSIAIDSGSLSALPDVAAIVAAGYTVVVVEDSGAITAAPSVATLAATGYVPQSIDSGDQNISRSPDVAAAQFTGLQPTAGFDHSAAVGLATVAVSGQPPLVPGVSSAQPDVGAIAVVGYAPEIDTPLSVVKTFTWASNLEQWVPTISGTNVTAALSAVNGSPPGSVTSNISGRNRSGNVNWQWSGQFTDLGIPLNSTVVSIEAASIQSRVSAYTVGAPSIVSAVTLSPVGFQTVELAASRSVSALESSFSTQVGSGAAGLSIPSSTSVVIGWIDSLTTGNSNSATVNIAHDNLTFRMNYVLTGVTRPELGIVQATGQSPVALVSDNAPVFLPGAGAALFGSTLPVVSIESTPFTPTVTPFGLLALSFNTQANLGGGGPGGLLALGLNLETPAGIVRPATRALSVTGYAPFTGTPIVDVGSGDDLQSGLATVEGFADRFISSPQFSAPATAVVSTVGYAATLTLADNVYVSPLTGSVSVLSDVPVSSWAGTIEVPLATVTVTSDNTAILIPPQQFVIPVPILRTSLFGYVPAVFESREAANPDVGSASVAGYAPTIIDGLNPTAASVTVTGYEPVATGAFTVFGAGLLLSRNGSTQAEGAVSRDGKGQIISGPGRFQTTFQVGPSGSGLLESGPGSLQGPVWRANGIMRSERASMVAFGKVLPYEFPTGERRAKGIEPQQRTRLKR